MKVAALILAAGEAKRFGYPKQILKWKDSTILGTVILEAVNSGFSDVYVVLGAHYQKIMETLGNELSLVKIVNNVNWIKGMFSSIKEGIRYALHDSCPDYILFQLGDMPFIKEEVVHKVMNLKTDKPIVAPLYKGIKGFPTLVRFSIFDEVLKLKGDTGIRKLIREKPHLVHFVEVDDPSVIKDVDTPLDTK